MESNNRIESNENSKGTIQHKDKTRSILMLFFLEDLNVNIIILRRKMFETCFIYILIL